MSKLGRLLHLPQLCMPQDVQRYLLLRYAFYLVSTMGITFAILKGRTTSHASCSEIS